MTTSQVLIALGSLAIAVLTVVLTLRRDRGLRPQVKVSLKVALADTDGDNVVYKILFIATNMGPGEVHLVSIPLKSLRRHKKGGGYKWGSVLPEGQPGGPGKLPVTLAVGKQALVLLPYRADSFLCVKHARAGLGDSFGRTHWVPKKELRAAEATYEKDFPLGPPAGATV